MEVFKELLITLLISQIIIHKSNAKGKEEESIVFILELALS
jgi:hypothetical protein